MGNKEKNKIPKLTNSTADHWHPFFIFLASLENLHSWLSCLATRLSQAQKLLSEIRSNFPKIGLTLPYKKVFKYYLGREQSFDKGFRFQFLIFSEMANLSLASLIKVLLIKKSVYCRLGECWRLSGDLLKKNAGDCLDICVDRLTISFTSSPPFCFFNCNNLAILFVICDNKHACRRFQMWLQFSPSSLTTLFLQIFTRTKKTFFLERRCGS